MVLEPPMRSPGLYELPVVAARTLAGQSLSSGSILALALAVACDGRCLEDQVPDPGASTSRIRLVEERQIVVVPVAVC